MKKGCDTSMNINVEVNLESGEANCSKEAVEYLGFSGCQVSNIKEKMKDIEIVNPIVTIVSRMKQSDLPKLEELAETMTK